MKSCHTDPVGALRPGPVSSAPLVVATTRATDGTGVDPGLRVSRPPTT